MSRRRSKPSRELAPVDPVEFAHVAPANDNALAKVLTFRAVPEHMAFSALAMVPVEVHRVFYDACETGGTDQETARRAWHLASELASVAVWEHAERLAGRPLARRGGRSIAHVVASLRARILGSS